MPIVFMYIAICVLFIVVALLARSLSKTNIEVENIKNLKHIEELEDLANMVSDQVDDLEFEYGEHINKFHSKKKNSKKKGV